MSPRVAEVLAAANALDEILFGNKAVDPEIIVRIFATLQNTIGTAKKSNEANVLSQVCAVSLFDPDIDASGADLGIWSEVPRGPTIVALASQSLLVNNTFTPSHAELASACRLAHRKIQEGLKVLLEWLDIFDKLDVSLLSRSRKSYEDWVRAYSTVENINLVEGIHDFVSRFEFKRPEWPHQVQRRDVARKVMWRPDVLREKFFAVMKTKFGLPLSDAELEGIFSACRCKEDFAMWFDREECIRQARLREEEKRRCEEEERRREEERWRKRSHECSFCGKAEKKVDHLINANAIQPFVKRPEPATICNECIERGANNTINSTLCWFCGVGATDKRVVLSVMDNQTTICEDCIKLCVKEIELLSHPVVDFTIGERGALTEKFAKERAEKFKKLVATKPSGAIILRINGYPDED